MIGIPSLFSLELKEGTKPHHSRPFQFQSTSERASPSFIKPKKNNTVHFISGFREVNKRLEAVSSLSQYQEHTKTQLNRLSDLGVLEFLPTSEWASPSFITPKKITL